jgi:hypothetical protein
MYILALGAVLLSLCIVAVERRRGSPAGGLVGVITLSFACFGLVTGLFWVVFPGLTASLVPGSVQTPLAAGVVQVRGALVVALAVFIVLTRATRAAGERVSGLAGPALYNVLMAYEAIAAQFTGIATAERWLYVVLHTSWAVGFVLLTIFPRATATAGGSSRPARVIAGLYGVYAVLPGIATVVVPTGLVQAFGEVPSPYVLHAVGSFASALGATGALALGGFFDRSAPLLRSLLLSLVVASSATAALGVVGVLGAASTGGVVIAAITLDAVLAVALGHRFALLTRSARAELSTERVGPR